MDPFDNRCRCDGEPMRGSDHCPSCFCEEFEERCRQWGRPWQELNDSEKWGMLNRRMRERR